jgi:predicted TPR repeat methyltransferase
MLPMEPVAAAAPSRALSWQFSRVFITLDSQHSTSLSDSMVLRCGSRSMQRGAVVACTVAVLRCSLQLGCGAGAAAQKVESRVRQFAGVAFSP